MCFTKKIGVCIKDCITADREKWERKRPTERKSNWEQAIGKYGRAGWADEKLASVCRGIVFWVLIFWSMLKWRKCNMQRWISNRTLAYCIWEEKNKKWHWSTHGHPVSARHHVKVFHTCSWCIAFPFFTVKYWEEEFPKYWFYKAIKKF